MVAMIKKKIPNTHMGARMACLKSDRFLHVAAMFDHEEFFGHSAYSYGCHYV